MATCFQTNNHNEGLHRFAGRCGLQLVRIGKYYSADHNIAHQELIIDHVAIKVPVGNEEPTSRIVSGWTAIPNEVPHQVGIRIVHSDRQAMCGGSIISTSWVLTAAQCTLDVNARYHMRFGSINFDNGGVVQVASEVIIHPKFEPDTFNNDAAVLRIPTPLTISASIRPIRLPNLRQIQDRFVGHRAVISGWGRVTHNGAHQQVLRVAQVSMAGSICQATYPQEFVTIGTLCTRGASNESPCEGDFGGPLFIHEDGVPTQIGIMSRSGLASRGGCSNSDPSLHARTSHFIFFIEEATGIPLRP